MSHTIILEVADADYEAIKRAAEVRGKTPAELIMTVLPHVLPKRDERLRRHFGTVDTGQPIGIDNEQIDADLAHAYGNRRDDEPS